QLTSLRHRYLVHVPVGSTAREIAVRVLEHPVRQVRSEFRFSHRALPIKACREHTIGRRIGQIRIQEQARFGAYSVTTLVGLRKNQSSQGSLLNDVLALLLAFLLRTVGNPF